MLGYSAWNLQERKDKLDMMQLKLRVWSDILDPLKFGESHSALSGELEHHVV
jgi:hypothetical protein